MLNQTFHYSDVTYDTYSVNHYGKPALSHPILSRLAQLSQQQQWILYTAQCPRPRYQQLSKYRIQCHKVIHMKTSYFRSEVEIVIQAILSGNASAIIASATIDIADQIRLRYIAKQHHCEVFFLNESATTLH